MTRTSLAPQHCVQEQAQPQNHDQPVNAVWLGWDKKQQDKRNYQRSDLKPVGVGTEPMDDGFHASMMLSMVAEGQGR